MPITAPRGKNSATRYSRLAYGCSTLAARTPCHGPSPLTETSGSASIDEAVNRERYLRLNGVNSTSRKTFQLLTLKSPHSEQFNGQFSTPTAVIILLN